MSPFLERGIVQEILEAKKVYRTMYKRNHKKEKRKVTKSIEVVFTHKEFEILTTEAMRHNLSRTKFIRQSTFAYIDKRYIVPNEAMLHKVLQALAMILFDIENREEENDISRINVLELKEQLWDIEKKVRINTVSPYTLEQIIEKEILKDISYKESLLTFIQTIR